MRATWFVTLICTSFAASAHAQVTSPDPAAPPVAAAMIPAPMSPRTGWELGAGLQGGEINCESTTDFCDGVTEAGGGNLQVTYMFRPKLGIFLDAWVMHHPEDNFTFSHVVSTVGVKWRPAPAFTVQAGVGNAHARITTNAFGPGLGASSRNAPAILLGLGYDVVRARHWVIDVHARVGAGFYGDEDADDIVGRNVGLGVGFSWLIN